MKNKTWYTKGLKSVETNDTNRCYICNSKNVYNGGSWTPECCRDCGAVYFFGAWHEPEPDDKPKATTSTS